MVTHIKGDKLGRSYTPDLVARAICARLKPLVAKRPRVVEPCVGGGAFARAAREVLEASFVLGVDLDLSAEGRHDVDYFGVGDACTYPLLTKFDLAITNPPFGKNVGQAITEGIVRQARKAARVAALLMPLDYQTQAGFEEHVNACAYIWPLLPRPFAHERGMCVYVWADTEGKGAAVFEQLRWRRGGSANNLT